MIGIMKDFRFATFALTGDVRRDAPTSDGRVRVAVAPRVRVRCAVNPGRDYAGEKEDVRGDAATFPPSGDFRGATFGPEGPTLDKIKIEKYGKDNEPND